MTIRRTIRARVEGQRLVPLEDLGLPDGAEVSVTFEVPEEKPRPRERITFRARPMGVKLPVHEGTVVGHLTREEIYEDVS